jgi:mRNA interferase MazF
MLLTTEYKRGDIVLVNFVFAEETGSKRRPVLVLSSDRYMEERQDVIVSAITSNTRRLLVGDHLMIDWEAAGLLFPSVTTGIIRTIKQSMIERKMGQVSLIDLDEIESNLTQILELSI